MNRTLWTRFLITSTLLISVGFAIGATVTPPDPLSQLPVLVAVVVLAIPVSYWFVYNGGFSHLQRRISN